MILLPHAIVASSLATAFKLDPFSALVVGFVSHFVLDRFPHWDYNLRSARFESESRRLEGDLIIGREFFSDLTKMVFDALAGLCLSLVFFSLSGQTNWIVVVSAVFGGLLPDALQFVYYKIDRRRLRLLQRFHLKAHSTKKIKDPIRGLLIYSFIIIFAIIFGSWRFFFWFN